MKATVKILKSSVLLGLLLTALSGSAFASTSDEGYGDTTASTPCTGINGGTTEEASLPEGTPAGATGTTQETV
jgi:hypothetical protein